jgi:hypothetical protein
MTMKASNWRILAATGAVLAGTVVWPIAGAVASPARAAQRASVGITRFGIHDAPNVLKSARADRSDSAAPKGIFAPFTNCPLTNPLMEESPGGSATGCVAGDAVSGTITIGPVSVPVEHPVTAQFGIWDPPNASPTQFSGGVLPPLNGQELVDSPENVPGGLLKALGCPNSTPSVEKLCRDAVLPGETTALTALAESAGPITNFDLTTWTQPIMIQLINPLLGPDCTIGSLDNPIVLNPSVTGPLNVEYPPNTTRFPNLVVFDISNAVAADDTFSAPVAQGCGLGGSANIAVDEAIDTSDGLPSPSGANSLVLNGNFYFADDYAATNMARHLLAAFRTGGN